MPFKKFDCVYATTIKLEDVKKNRSFLTKLSCEDLDSYYEEIDKLIILEEDIYNTKDLKIKI